MQVVLQCRSPSLECNSHGSVGVKTVCLPEHGRPLPIHGLLAVQFQLDAIALERDREEIPFNLCVRRNVPFREQWDLLRNCAASACGPDGPQCGPIARFDC